MSETIKPTVKRIFTSATSEQRTPDYEFKNPFDSDVELNGISILPDNSFRARGLLRVVINDVPVPLIDGNDLIGVAKVQLIEGNSIKKLNRQKSIKFFMWNPVDNLTVAVTIGITLGKI